MTTTSFSVTELVTAVRCPRQLILSREDFRVVPYGSHAFGTAAHAALHSLVSAAATDERLHALLDAPIPDREAVIASLFRLALPGAHAHAKRVASRVDGGDLARFSDIVRHLATLLAAPLTRACGEADNGSAAVRSVFLASEQEVTLTLGDVTVRGKLDLVCRDVGETWLWDLKTYAGSDLAELEQVRIYALAYEKSVAPNASRVRPSLMHVTQDRIEIRRADPLDQTDTPKLTKLVSLMRNWVGGSPPPPAPDLGTCRTCPAQGECWRRWGRTLPDDVDVVRSSIAAPDATEAARSPVGGSEVEPAPGASRKPISETKSEVEPTPNGSGLHLGMGSDRKPVVLEPSDLMRHVAVFGASGSGKTYLAKAIVEEALLAGIPVLAFDVQGDILSLARTLEDAAVDPGSRARRDAYREKVEYRLLTPMSDAGLRLSLNPLKFPTGKLAAEQTTVLAEAMAENLLAHAKQSPTTRDYVKMYLAGHLRAAMASGPSITIEDLIARIAAEEDIADEIVEEPQRKKLVKDLRLLTMGSKGIQFREGRPMDLDTILTPNESGKTPLNVLWLNGLADQSSKEGFVAMVLADVYAWMLRQRGSSPRVLLYFDEIGPYMPPNGEPPTKKLLKRIFKEGRKYGVCGLFCTQNFTDVDYKVVSQANTLAVGRLNAAQEKKKAVDALGTPAAFDVPRAVPELLSSRAGRFILKRLDGTVDWLQARRLLTVHGSPWGEEEIREATSDEQRNAWSSNAGR